MVMVEVPLAPFVKRGKCGVHHPWWCVLKQWHGHCTPKSPSSRPAKPFGRVEKRDPGRFDLYLPQARQLARTERYVRAGQLVGQEGAKVTKVTKKLEFWSRRFHFFNAEAQRAQRTTKDLIFLLNNHLCVLCASALKKWNLLYQNPYLSLRS